MASPPSPSGEEPSSTRGASGAGAMPKQRTRRPIRSETLVPESRSVRMEHRNWVAVMRIPESGREIRQAEEPRTRSSSTVTFTPERASKASPWSAV